jgi:enamine deaminase RidA (YjgF/YER057c/UK114 family)
MSNVETLHHPFPPPGDGPLDQMRETIEMQNRTIRYLLANYDDLLRKVEREHGGGGGGGGGSWPPSCGIPGLPSTSLPFPQSPISVGAVAPVDQHYWFNTSTSVLAIWFWKHPTGGGWSPIDLNVTANAVPPATSADVAGTTWLDATGRLWAFEGIVWTEITYPVVGAPIPAAGIYPMVVALAAPATPGVGQLWLEPRQPRLSQWNGTTWLTIGIRPPRRVKIMYNPGSIETTGTWTVGIRAGDTLHLAGSRGIDPVTNLQIAIPLGSEAVPGTGRIVQAFTNLQMLANSEGCTIFDVSRLMVFLTNMFRDRPIVNSVQTYPQFWGKGPYPNRTILAVAQLNGTDLEGEWLSPVLETMGPGAFAPTAGQGTLYTGDMYVRSRGDICEAQASLYAPFGPHGTVGADVMPLVENLKKAEGVEVTREPVIVPEADFQAMADAHDEIMHEAGHDGDPERTTHARRRKR